MHNVTIPSSSKLHVILTTIQILIGMGSIGKYISARILKLIVSARDQAFYLIPYRIETSDIVFQSID